MIYSPNDSINNKTKECKVEVVTHKNTSTGDILPYAELNALPHGHDLGKSETIGSTTELSAPSSPHDLDVTNSEVIIPTVPAVELSAPSSPHDLDVTNSEVITPTVPAAELSESSSPCDLDVTDSEVIMPTGPAAELSESSSPHDLDVTDSEVIMPTVPAAELCENSSPCDLDVTDSELIMPTVPAAESSESSSLELQDSNGKETMDCQVVDQDSSGKCDQQNNKESIVDEDNQNSNKQDSISEKESDAETIIHDINQQEAVKHKPKHRRRATSHFTFKTVGIRKNKKPIVKLSCPKCQMQFTLNKDLSDHLKTQHKRFRFFCKVCHKKFMMQNGKYKCE